MKIVVFSDIHGNQYSFWGFIQEMTAEHPDKMIFLGDVFGYYYGQEEILSWLRESDCHSLLGNHDKMFLELLDGKQSLMSLVNKYGSGYERNITLVSSENIEFLKYLPTVLELQIDGLRIGAVHGTFENPLEGRIYPDTCIEHDVQFQKYDLVFLGHTHHKILKKVEKTWIINPGSLGQQRDGLGCSYVILDTATKHVIWKKVDYDVEKLDYEIQQKDTGNQRLLDVLYRKASDVENFYGGYSL